jgi:hypothetical protein
VSRIAKKDFIRMSAHPAGAQPTGQVAANSRCEQLNRNEPARMPKVATEILLLDHGDTETSPRPAPNVRRAKESAEATTAPATTAAQDTPDADASPPESAAREVMTASAMASSNVPTATQMKQEQLLLQ